MQTWDSVNNSSAYIVEQQRFILGRDIGLSTPIQLLKYDLNHYDDQLYSTLKIKKPHQSKSWVTKRRAQFLAGRLVAREALYSIDNSIKEKNEVIPIGRYREALWPEQIAGSISHSDGISIAVAQTKNSKIQSVGVDLQSVLDEEDITKCKQVILTSYDQTLMEKGVDGLSFKQLFTLIFSAKESFFKAAFHSVGDYFNFDVVYVKSINQSTRQITLKCHRSLNHEVKEGNEYQVAYSVLETSSFPVITYCHI